MTERQAANRELVRLLSEWVEKYPDMRFGQILRDGDFVQLRYVHLLGCYYWANDSALEPTELLKRVRRACE